MIKLICQIMLNILEKLSVFLKKNNLRETKILHIELYFKLLK